MISAVLSLAMSTSQVEPGTLFLVGGGSTPDSVAEAFLETVGRDKLIVVFGQVREEPANANSSRDWLIEKGAKFVILMDFETITDLHKSSTEKLLAQAGGIWIPGGDQNLMVERWGEDWAAKHLGDAVRRGASYFGTSAGAMLASETMIAGPGPEPNTALYRRGLGLTPFMVESHMRERNREARLRFAMQRTGVKQAIGLSEKEWVKIKGDQVTIGEGSPLLIKD